jgi:hypothetical protein
LKIAKLTDFFLPNSHLCHASDAEQAELILNRWYVDGIGKLAGSSVSFAAHKILLLMFFNRACVGRTD